MTAKPAPELAEIAARCRHLLLDFDGPICSVFAGMSAPEVASKLRGALRSAGIEVPPDAEGLDDPLEVFRIVAMREEVTELAQQELTALELAAIATARPTEGSADLITTARATGRSVSIVTNNSSAAAHAYLEAHGLAQHIGLVIGREPDPDRMKPSPYGVRAAVGILDTTGDQCAFVGDSPSDVLAGLLAGVPVIGYANKPGKADALTQRYARAVTTQLSEITAALRTAPCPALPN